MGLETSSQYERLLTTRTMSPSFTVILQHKGGHLQSNVIYKNSAKITEFQDFRSGHGLDMLVVISRHILHRETTHIK